jgi:hypothetical protein
MNKVEYEQATLEEAKQIAFMNGQKYTPGTLHLYKYPTKESVAWLKQQTPFVRTTS